tara:strand:- start:1565 stop:2050 length:486 start_codon:yes stop_codon:yes gene_type:complete
MNQNQENRTGPKYKVMWMGKNNPTHTFVKYFDKLEPSVDFSRELDEGLVYEFKKAKDKTVMWELIPSKKANELIKSVRAKRRIKNNFSHADGEVDEDIETRLAEKQKFRLLKGVVLAPFMVYTGYNYNLPPLFRYALIGGGIFLGVTELKYLLINRKLNKS